MNLAEAVKEYRRLHKYSLREFAEICGLSHVQIFRLENGMKADGTPFEPKINTLKKLAAGMGVSIDEVLNWCEETVIRWDPEDISVPVSEDKKDIIGKIILSTPEQFDLIRSYVNFVMKA